MFIILSLSFFFFFFNDTATTEIYTLSLHDALPISRGPGPVAGSRPGVGHAPVWRWADDRHCARPNPRSEEHTSELQSRLHLVCRLLLEKKKKQQTNKQRGTGADNDDARTHDVDHRR